MKVSECRTPEERHAYLQGAMAMHARTMAAFNDTIAGTRLDFLDAFEAGTKELLAEIERANNEVAQ